MTLAQSLETTTEEKGRQLTMPVATAAALVIAIVTGLTSGGLASSSSSATVRESMVRMEGELKALRDEVRRQGDEQARAAARMEAEMRAGFARLDATDRGHDERLRAVELHQARQQGAPAPR